MAEFYIGTSGFSYDDWVGPVYPPDLPKSEWLTYYATVLGFNACELNFSFYTMPSVRTLAQLAQKVPFDFRFTVKAPQVFTHDRNASDEDWEKFRRVLRPLELDEKLGCVLVQFPYSFHNTPENRAYVEEIRHRWPDLDLVVEFRNREWVKDDVFAWLRELRIGFCCVDQPRFRNLIPPIAVVTAPIAYVRFHGRNKEKWWQHEHPWERYDYEYSPEELQEWVPKIQRMAEEASVVYLFANNHYRGKAVRTAQMLAQMLRLPLPQEGKSSSADTA